MKSWGFSRVQGLGFRLEDLGFRGVRLLQLRG